VDVVVLSFQEDALAIFARLVEDNAQSVSYEIMNHRYTKGFHEDTS
jgi:hypothetical protein